MTLAELRRSRGLTQTCLAERLHIKQQSVQAIESGRTKPSVKVALLIQREFGLTGEEVWTMLYADDDGEKESDPSEEE